MTNTKRAKLSDLTPDLHNANKGTQRGLKALDTSLRQYGAGRSILLDKHNRIIAGNKTVERSADIGLNDVIIVETDGTQLVAVKRTDLDLETDGGKARALAIFDNRVGELDLDWNIDALGALDGDVLQDLWTEQELEKLGVDFGREEGDAEPQIDKAEELRVKWGVSLGQLWRMASRDGKRSHYLICGDCTDKDVVGRVMGGERAVLFITDAPYGVSYADKNRFLNAVWPANRVEKPIENDHQTVDEMANLWLRAFCIAYDICDDGAAYYICSPQGGELMMMMMMMIERSGFLLKHSIIWVKNQFVIGRSDYHYKHEPILYGWKEGGHKFYGDRGECSVWEIDKPHTSGDHPTMKPVELFERAIRNSTESGAIVYDGFLGSGTTIIAAENLSRQCRAVEISPGYCAVSLQRYQDSFGITAELIEDAP